MKRIFIGLIVATITIVGAGCSRKGACAECNQMDTLKPYVVQGNHSSEGIVAGDKVYLCEDCTRLAKIIGF